jgi:RNA polymerase sigma-70 factor, ECF subfamily
MTDDVGSLRPRLMSVAYRMLGSVAAVLSLWVEGSVRAVYITRNPDKLGRWAAAEIE